MRTIWAHVRREKKHESQREEKTSSSLFLSLSSRARHVLTPTKNGHVGHCPILSRLQFKTGGEFKSKCSNSCARELEIPTEFRRDTTQSEKQRQQQKDDDERKERRVRKRTFARLFVLRKEDCVFCVARIREFKREKRTRKKPLNGTKNAPPQKKEKQKAL